MKYKGLLTLTLILIIVNLGGCTAKRNTSVLDYTTISAQEAKAMIDDNGAITILDVRTEEEYKSGHIKDAVLLPDYELLDKAEEILPDKDATILVYCRSGRRSASAAGSLVQLGYSNVYDFGGILDWEYETVTE